MSLILRRAGGGERWKKAVQAKMQSQVSFHNSAKSSRMHAAYATALSDFASPSKFEQESHAFDEAASSHHYSNQPLATAYSDFVAPSKNEQKESVDISSYLLNDPQPLATAYSDAVAPSRHEQEEAFQSKTSLSSYVLNDPRPLSTAYADAVAPSQHEQDNSSLSLSSSLESYVLSNPRPFATAYSDLVGPTEHEQQKEVDSYYSSEQSMATAFSDFAAPTAEEQQRSEELFVLDASYRGNNGSMATALSDFASPSEVEQEYRSSEWSDELSFSAPESDYQAQADLALLSAVLEDNEKDIFAPAMYSFASPESDFMAGILTEEKRAYDDFGSKALEDSRQSVVLPKSFAEAIASKDSTDALVVTESVAPYRIVSVNAAWERLCGFTNEESVGKTLNILQGPETDIDKVDSNLYQLNEGHEVNMVLTNYTKDGRKFLNELTMGPLRDDETVTHFVAVLKEISNDRNSISN